MQAENLPALSMADEITDLQASVLSLLEERTASVQHARERVAELEQKLTTAEQSSKESQAECKQALQDVQRTCAQLQGALDDQQLQGEIKQQALDDQRQALVSIVQKIALLSAPTCHSLQALHSMLRAEHRQALGVSIEQLERDGQKDLDPHMAENALQQLQTAAEQIHRAVKAQNEANAAERDRLLSEIRQLQDEKQVIEAAVCHPFLDWCSVGSGQSAVSPACFQLVEIDGTVQSTHALLST